MSLKPQFPADLVTFTEEILNAKLHFLFSVPYSLMYHYSPFDLQKKTSIPPEFLLEFIYMKFDGK